VKHLHAINHYSQNTPHFLGEKKKGKKYQDLGLGQNLMKFAKILLFESLNIFKFFFLKKKKKKKQNTLGILKNLIGFNENFYWNVEIEKN
jgi:hypothetical protein